MKLTERRQLVEVSSVVCFCLSRGLSCSLINLANNNFISDRSVLQIRLNGASLL